jgi:hypothetical protein
VKLYFVEYIAESEITPGISEFQVPDVKCKIGGDVIIFFRHSAEMDRLVILYAHAFENIQDKIENIGYIPVGECIGEYQDVSVKDKQVEELPFDMHLNIMPFYAFAVVR